MNKTLIIMAAGMGSRFGGDGAKQTASLGPAGEMLMEYSIYDAALAGFDKFIFIISEKMKDFFPGLIRSKVRSENVHFAVQSFDSLPEWYAHPADRTKPYGTVAAILSAKGLVTDPFAVINADDYYGRAAFADLAAQMDRLAETGEACMVTYPLAPTLSHTGAVTRGLCRISDAGTLTELIETKGVLLDENNCPYVLGSDGERCLLPADIPVSMNIFGFTPWMMEQLSEGFDSFLHGLTEEAAMTAEYPVPVFLDRLMAAGRLVIKAAPTDSLWFGVTYQEDSDSVRTRLACLAPLYPDMHS